MRRCCVLFVLLTLALWPAGMAWAEPTDIVVHVRSKGAKFIGSSMGGMLVTMENAMTGELLATGYTRGATGDTDRIMKEPHTTYAPITTPETARFATTLELDEPTLLRVTAKGPMTNPDGGEASAAMWVMPGKHVNGGDAWTLELPGFVVDVVAPLNHVKLPEPQTVRVEANITLGCGCPVTPGGLWDAADYELGAVVLRDGERLTELTMEPTGEDSTRYAVDVEAEAPGVYEVQVYAYDPANGNTGLDRSTFIIQ